MKLHELKNTHRTKKKSMRVGRGIGSKGKTCGRGTKGAKARSGYKRRAGNEGGQRPVFRKIPIRGFSRAGFQKDEFSINLALVDRYFEEGDVVSHDTLKAKNLFSGKAKPRLKILGNGELTKKITFEVHAVSKTAEEKIQTAKGTLKLIK